MATIQVHSMDHLNMHVKNLQESVKFYGELFGFTLKKDQPEENSQIIGNDAVKLCMYEVPEEVGEKGISHFGFNVVDFDAAVARCEAMGIVMDYGVIQWEHSRSVYIKDPNGYTIELSEVAGGGL